MVLPYLTLPHLTFSCIVQGDEGEYFESPARSGQGGQEISNKNSKPNKTSREKEKAYPKVPVIYSLEDLNENRVRVTTQIAADHTLPIQTDIMVVGDVANDIFGQNDTFGQNGIFGQK